MHMYTVSSMYNSMPLQIHCIAILRRCVYMYTQTRKYRDSWRIYVFYTHTDDRVCIDALIIVCWMQVITRESRLSITSADGVVVYSSALKMTKLN